MKYFISLFFVFFATQLAVAQTTMIINKYDGTTESINFSDIKNITFAENLIKNGSFKNALTNWLLIGKGTNPYHPEDPGRADFNVVDGVLEINMTNEGISIYSIMLYQSVAFEKDATYIISFDAKSDSPVEIISNITQDVTWTNFSGDRKFNLTTSVSSFTYSFKMPVSGPALFQYCLGIRGTGKLYFDNISIRKEQ